MRDVLTSGSAFFQFSILVLVVAAAASAIGTVPYFADSFAFSQASTAISMFNYVALFVVLGFFIVSVGLAAFSRNNRVFLPVSILFLVIDVVLSAVFSDVFVALVQSSSLLGSASEILSLMTLLASNLPVVIGVMGLTVIVATYTNIAGGGRRAPR